MTPKKTPKKKTSEAPSYTEAVKELEQILGAIEGSEVDLDLLAGRVERASELVKMLKARIKATEMKVARVVEDLREATEKEPGNDTGKEEAGSGTASSGTENTVTDGEPPLEDDLFGEEDHGDSGDVDDTGGPDEQVPF